MHAKHPIWRKERTLRETCFVSVLTFLGSKTLKRTNSTLYRETEQYYQKHLFGVFIILLDTKMPKCMQSTLYGETKPHNHKHVCYVFLSVFVPKIVKIMWIKRFRQKCILMIVFQLLWYKTQIRVNSTLYEEIKEYD